MSRYLFSAALAISALLLVPAAGAAGGDASQAVHVRGSTTLLPMAQRVAETYMAEHPGATVAVSAGGTAHGYKSVLDGTADVGLVSGPLPLELEREMTRRGIKLVSVTAAYNAIVPIVHASNPLNSLTTGQLKHIFTGRIVNWKDAGGKSAPIKVFVGPPSGGITEAWKEAILGDDGPYTAKGIVLATGERVRRVAADPLAISFVAFGGADPSVKVLRINDVAASTETVLDGRYPLRSPLMLITTDRPSAAARDFVHYFSIPNKRNRFAGIVTVESLD